MATEWLVNAAAAKALHVPYKGGAPAVSAVAGNEVVFTVAGLPGVLPHLMAKRVKVLGVTTAKRSPQVPDYMSAQEAGIPGVDASIWVGLFAPKGTPKEVISKLYQASAEVLKNPDIKKRYATVGGAETTTIGHGRIQQAYPQRTGALPQGGGAGRHPATVTALHYVSKAGDPPAFFIATADSADRAAGRRRD